jgi:general secretion pathway protein A
MYEFFGLSCEPFSIAADPRFMYMSPQHRQALAHLQYGFRRGAGFILLTGEIGAGKTTVCRLFLRELPANVDVANVVNPRLSATALLTRVCEDLRIELPSGTVDLIDAIHGHLLLADSQGRRSLIVVDEAQALAPDVLEQLRLLSNLDSSGGKLQVFLIGQPELRNALQTSLLEPLAQRVVARFHLTAMPEKETALYISHRLNVAGRAGPGPFEAPAVIAVHRICQGVPRRINVLCDRAMHVAKAAGSHTITPQMVEQAAEDSFDSPRPEAAADQHSPPPSAPAVRVPRRWPALTALAAGALLLGAYIGAQRARQPERVEPASAPAFASAAGVEPAATSVAAGQTPVAVNTVESDRPAPEVTSSRDASEPIRTSPPAILANTDEAEAWRALAKSWDVTLPATRPCAAAVRLGLRCYHGIASLDLLRHLDRPGFLRLVNADGSIAFAEVSAISGDEVTFRMGDVRQNLPLTSLAGQWHGEFSTFWRPPPGYRADGSGNDAAELNRWLDGRFAVIGLRDTATPAGDASGEARLAARISAFQLAHGLQPDGRLGPLTIMQLNRAGGAEEPRLGSVQ